MFLSRFAAVIRTALRTSFLVSYDARESYENSLIEHWAVIDAIRKRMPGEAERAMRFLLKGTARDLAPAFPHIKPEQAQRHARPRGAPVRAARRGRPLPSRAGHAPDHVADIVRHQQRSRRGRA